MLIAKENQEEEIVFRNNGNVDDLLNHIEQEIHLSSIIHLKIIDGIQKSMLEVKLNQLYEIKMGLQQALVKYRNMMD